MREALARVLGPLVRVSIAQGMRFSDVSDLLKEVYVDECEKHFRLENKRLTDSRVSVLTGLHRRDVKALRLRISEAADERDTWKPGMIPRVLAHWSGVPDYRQDGDGPRILPRLGDRPSFATLVAEVSQDVHHRTVLDELAQLGLVAVDAEADTVQMIRSAYLPSHDIDAMLGYLGANLGDHAETAAGNIRAYPNPGPYFERALHYDNLCGDSVDKIEAVARRRQMELLNALNEISLQYQTRDRARTDKKYRFRFGAYIFRKEL